MKKVKTEFDKTKIYLVAAIRKIWRWSKPRRDALKGAKECYVCKQASPKGEYQADHVQPVGSAPRSWLGWDAYLERMFEGKLSPICTECHKIKTRAEGAARRAAKKKELI